MAQTTAPDVRVRLSAEGVQDVLAAFKRISDEANRSGKGGAKGILLMKGAIQSVAAILPALSFGAIVAGAVALTKGALDNADAMGKMAQKTGLAVETLSVLSLGAKTADVEQEALNKSLIKFVKNMDDVDQHAGPASNAVRQLFGSASALDGLNVDQKLLKVTNALAKLAPGAKQTALAIDFFGKSGAELLPLINDLGEGGFDQLREKAQKLGLVIDKDLAEAAQRANDAMTDLKSQAEGVATQFIAGLAPDIATSMQAIGEAVSQDGTNGFRELGEIAGSVLKFIVVFLVSVALAATEAFADVSSVVTNTFDLIGKVLDNSVQKFELWKKGVKAALTGDFDAAESFHKQFDAIKILPDNALSDFTKNVVNDAAAAEKTVTEKMAKVLAALDGGDPKKRKHARDHSTSQNLDQLDKEAKARRALLEALADNELAIEKAKLAASTDEEKRKLENGLTSLAAYYDKRKQITEEGAQAELDVLTKKLAIETAAPLQKGETQAEKDLKVAKLETDIAVKKIGLESDLKDIADDRINATRENSAKVLAAENQIKAAEGDRFAQARAELEEQLRLLDIVLAKEGKSAQERAAIINKQRTLGTADIDFQSASSAAAAALADLDAKRQEIINKVRSGVLFEFQGQQQIADLEKSRIPALQKIADLELQAAIAAGNPEQVQRARELKAAIDDLVVSSDTAALKMGEFKQAVQDSLTSDLTDFFTNGIDQADSFGDAMRGLALSVVDSLRRIAAQMLATFIMSKLLGLVFAGVGAAAGGAGGTLGDAGGVGGPLGGGTVNAASGGLVRGPGTGISDSIPARLSDFEYVVRSAVVRQPGVLEFLRQLNREGIGALRSRGTPRGFAEGGLVTATGGGERGRADLTLGLDEGLLLRRLEANPFFARVMIRTVSKHSKAVNGALGGRGSNQV